MIKRFVAMVLLILPCLVSAQSSLPPCPESGLKHNCVGVHLYSNGEQYVGEFLRNRQHGLGILYTSDGASRLTGRWEDDQFRERVALDTNRFPFNPPSRVAGVSAVQLVVQQKLETCSGSYWNRCVGSHLQADGSRYIGEWVANQPHGRGTLILSTGETHNGIWVWGEFKSGIPNESKVAEELQGQSSQAGGQGQAKAERDRLAEEVEAERKKRQELAVQLAEAKERERQQAPQPQRPQAALRREVANQDSTYPSCSKSQHLRGTCVGIAEFGVTRYFGELVDGIPHGNGVLIYPDGSRWVGHWRLGLRDGKGVQIERDGLISRSGLYFRGEINSEFDVDITTLAFSRIPEIGYFVSNTESADTSSKPKEAEISGRDRLLAEVEAERKKRQELEQKLAEAEAKERERQQAQTPQPPQPQAAIRNERRVALLVGNGAYKHSPLTNSVNDAVDLNASLKNLGFQTLLVQNASLAMMRQKTREFAELALNADVALIFFSGHGIEYRGNNYLIPTSAGSLKEFEVEDETFNVARWMDMLETQKGANKQRVNIVILDACRDNAFSRSWRNTNRGLARMDAPSGTILAYATAPGKLASDGSAGERNSPYTKNLLRAIQQPNVPVEQVFKDVRRMVVEQTKGEQVPWENSSLIGNFVFKR